MGGDSDFPDTGKDMVPFLLKTGCNCMKYFIRSTQLNHRPWHRNIYRAYSHSTRSLSFSGNHGLSYIKHRELNGHEDIGYYCSPSTPHTHHPVSCFHLLPSALSHHTYIPATKAEGHPEVAGAHGLLLISSRELTKGGPPAP